MPEGIKNNLSFGGDFGINGGKYKKGSWKIE